MIKPGLLVALLVALSTLAVGTLRAEESPASPPQVIKLSQLGPDASDKIVADQAVIDSILPPGEDNAGLYKIYLKHGKAKLPLVMLRKTWEELPFSEELRPGATLYFRAEVLAGSEETGPSLFVYHASHLSISAPPGKIKAGQVVTRTGKFRSIQPTKGGVVIELKEPDATTLVFAAFTVSSKLPVASFSENCTMIITGRLQPPGSDTQLALERVEDCVVVRP